MDWDRIGDDEVATFGCRVIRFIGKDKSYRVSLDDRNQGRFNVSYENRSDTWDIMLKEQRNGVIRLSGFTGLSPYPPDCFWFELTLSVPAIVRLYGDRVLLHEDWERPAS